MQTPEEYEVTLRIQELLKELKKRKGYTKKVISLSKKYSLILFQSKV